MNFDTDLTHAVNVGKLTEKEAAAKQAERDEKRKPAKEQAAVKGEAKGAKVQAAK